MIKPLILLALASTTAPGALSDPTISVPQMGLKDARISDLSDHQRLAALRLNLCTNYDPGKLSAQLAKGQSGVTAQVSMTKLIVCTPPRPHPETLR